jgi:hypothetical protein
MHAGGETSFAFVTDHRQQSRPRSWEMKIFGPPERLLDSVLPHEVTHTIFASHFGQPLPRWADEGACTIVEHESERRKNHQMLIDFLHTNRGIPFNRMFEMKQYPHDILPLYAQGHSLSKFLVMQKGKRHFLDFIAAGMAAEQQGPLLRGWDRATKEYYGFRDLSELQEAWISWVRAGSRELPNTDIANVSGNNHRTNVSTENRSLANPQRFAQARTDTESDAKVAANNLVNVPTYNPADVALASHNEPVTEIKTGRTDVVSGSWYVRQSQSSRASSQRQPLETQPTSESPASKGQMSFQPLSELSGLSEKYPVGSDNQSLWR